MKKCEICKYQKDCPDIVEENSIYCLTHRKIPKNFDNEYIEKQQLIKFLEDKINNLSSMTAQFITIGDKVTSIPEIQIKTLQEVLDFCKRC